MNKLKINLKDLRGRPGQKIGLIINEIIDDLSLKGPAIGEIVLASNSATVRLNGKISACVSLVCHSCLNSFLQPLSIDLDEEFVYEDYLNEKNYKVKEKELLREDFFENIPYDGSIDVLDIIRQSIVLATPNHCICGSDCGGIYKEDDSAKGQKAPASGAKRESAIDPRWHNLKTIFSNDTQKEKVRDNKV